MAFYSNLRPEDLSDLLDAYDHYIGAAADANLFRTGWTPVCIEEFYEIEYQNIWKQGQDFSECFFEASEMAARDINAHDLAVAVDAFYYDFDPYEYKDQIGNDREAAVADLEAKLLAGNSRDLIEHLKNEIAAHGETDEYSMAAKLLITQLQQLQGEIEASVPNQQENADQAHTELVIIPEASAAQVEYIVRTEAPDRVDICCYADQVLPPSDRAELIDSHYCAHFVVPRDWAEEQAKKCGYRDLDAFYNDYTWDTTDGWYTQAFQDGVLLGVSLGLPAYEEHVITKDAQTPLTFDQKLSRAKESTLVQKSPQSRKNELCH